jgi:hypothetical protein
MSSIAKSRKRVKERARARNKNKNNNNREYLKCGCYYESMEEDTIQAFRPVCCTHTIKGRRYDRDEGIKKIKFW